MAKPEQVIFGRYEVIGELGRGSMGVVYKARDPMIGRLLAIKSIPETFGLASGKREAFIKRLRQEAMTAGRLAHPNIVTIFDVGESEQGPFIAMEYLDGVTLRDVISADKNLTLKQLVDIVAQVAEGLDYAHSRAIVHRDIKPANIMIVADNRVKIMDLGIARLPMSELTKEGKLVGSPSYMSPEQLAGKPIDGRSDLFSLGVCVYQLMTLKKPFPGEGINEICYKIVHDDFIPPSVHNPGLPPEFDELMRIALAKDPAERFQTGRELVEAVALVADIAPPARLETVERQAATAVIKDTIPAERSEAGVSSSPSLTQSSNIDDIFKELTFSARITDLSRQQTGKPFNWWLLAAGATLFALVATAVFFLTRS
jgi:serine/threonine-protein kinase